ncbi:hypothetical protein [Erythrobacter sp. THAF29]|uniref:hypothetical protein n=1 Tax=Erythrobacter sp. THAF29 TaxID=2587851 RepID=UPI001267875D|nr:hypothetical protein [Erythrobacter sp. THAF29]QFT77764.1 hypothetical protein FIU90_09480 [Erythrobacter sp. THAF29]
MNSLTVLSLPIAFLILTACGSDPDVARGSNAADDFAARINGQGGKGAPLTQQDPQAPTVAEPLPDAAEGVYVPGTATDPQAATCDANRMGPFIGRVADATTRSDIGATAVPGREIRFLHPGAESVDPDPSSPRLNLMLDGQDIIRDARCG